MNPSYEVADHYTRLLIEAYFTAAAASAGELIAALDNTTLNKYFIDRVVPAKDQTKLIIQKLMPDLDKIFDYVNSKDARFSNDIRHVGSYYQGLKVKRSDEFDFNLSLNGYELGSLVLSSCPHSPARRPTEQFFCCFYGFVGKDNEFWRKAHTKPQEMADGSKTNLHITLDKNYTLENKSVALDLPVVNYWTSKSDQQVVGYESLMFQSKAGGGSWHLIPFLVKLRLKELLTEAIDKCKFKGSFTLSPTAHGPALTLRYEHPSDDIKFPISVDISPTIRCSSCTLQCLGTWPITGKKWPPLETVEDILATKISLVAKHNFYWYMNFAECEKELCKYCDSCDSEKQLCRKKVQRIMKSLHKQFWCPEANPQISSYILKNVWMLEMEKLPNADDWTADKLRARLFGCIASLMKYVKEFIQGTNTNGLPQYFNRANNLLLDKDKVQLQKEYDKIKLFYDNPAEYNI